MANLLWMIILGVAVVVVIEIGWTMLSQRGVDRKALRKRNLFYPFHQFKMALANPDLKTYLGELSDECVTQLFEQGDLSLARYWEIAPHEIEQICIHHNRKMPARLDSKWIRSSNPPRWLGPWCPYALLHLARTYIQGKASAAGQQFIQQFLAQHRPLGYQVLLGQSNPKNKNELARIYPDEFFQEVTKLEELQQYVNSLAYLTEIYAKQQAGPKAALLLEKLVISHGSVIYPLLLQQLHHGDDKQFALEMIQNHNHIPVPMKIEILRCRQGNHFVDASIAKLQQKQGFVLT